MKSRVQISLFQVKIKKKCRVKYFNFFKNFVIRVEGCKDNFTQNLLKIKEKNEIEKKREKKKRKKRLELRINI